MQQSLAMEILIQATGWVAIVFLAFVGAIIIYRMWDGTIRIEKIISEEDGKASLSRLQFLIFTFVIGGGLVHIVVKSQQFPKIGSDVFMLLGISALSYVGAKVAQKNTGNSNTGSKDAAGGGSE